MTFNGNQAWQEGMAAIRANRSMLLPVAGVFFLLPSLVSVWFFSDVQMAMIENFSDPTKAERALQTMGAGTWASSLIGMLLQLVGFMTLLALFRDHGRPTVGDAIGLALKSLPTLVGAMLLFFFAYGIVALAAMALIGGLAALTKSVALAGFLGLALFVLVCHVLTRLSLTMPVIVIDRVTNPLHALGRSWLLTKANSLRLFTFYLLLGIGYVVVALVLFSVLGALIGIGQLTSASLVPGSAALIGMGLLSGLVSAVVSMIFSAILAAIHRQLAGPSTGAIAETFL